MHIRYRFLLALALAALAVTFSIGASGASDAEDPPPNSCGNGVIYSYDNGTLTIEATGEGTGEMNPYYDPGNGETAPWYDYREQITTLVIKDGVTSIGNRAFKGCGSLTGELKIPNSVKAIYQSAFQGCSSLTSLTLPDNAEFKTIGPYAFEGCSSLTGELKIPNSVERIDNFAFKDCKELNGKLTLPDNSEFTTISTASFEGCGKLKDALQIPGSVTTIQGRAFKDCGSLTGELKIPSTVESIGSEAFSGCKGFDKGLTLPDNSKFTIIEHSAFKGCEKLTGELKIPSTVTEIRIKAFEGCESLTGALKIPDSVVGIYASAFEGCKGFDGKLTLPGGSNPVLTQIAGAAFKGCENLTGTPVIPNSVKIIGTSAFEGCKSLTGELKIPDSVETIGPAAFKGCEGFDKGLTLTKNSKFTKISDSTFEGCSGLTGVLEIPSTVKIIGGSAFEGCKSLTGELKIPGPVESIGAAAFKGCEGFDKGLTLPDNSKFTKISDSTFEGCTQLKGNSEGTLAIPDSVESIGAAAFKGCEGFDRLILNDGLQTIEGHAFQNCINIGSLETPKTLQTIGESAFEDCSSISSLDFKEGLKRIQNLAFSGCNSLKDVTMPSGVEFIDGRAFGDIEFHDCISSVWNVVAPRDSSDPGQRPDVAGNLGGKVWKGVGDTKLYRSLKITFDAETNGGEFDDGDGKKVFWTVIRGVLPSFPSDPLKTNYTFEGWFSDKVKKDTEYKDGYGFTADSTAYSQWKGKPVNVEFDGDGAKPTFASREYEYGSNYDPLPDLDDGFILLGWYHINETTGEKKLVDEGSVVSTLDSHKLTGEWDCTVTGHIANGTIDKTRAVRNMSIDITIRADKDYLVPSSVTVTIGGAEVEADYDRGIISIPGSKVGGPIVVTGVCTHRPLTVTVDTSDPGIASIEYMIGDGGPYIIYESPFEVVYGSKLTLRAVVEDGYDFKEWSPGNIDAQLTIGSVNGDIGLAPKAVKHQPSPGPSPAPPKPKPTPPIITVTVTIVSTDGGKTSTDSVKVPLNSKVSVYGDTLVIGSGNATVKAIPDEGYAFSEWIIPEGNLLSDTVITSVFSEVVIVGMYIWKEPDRLDYCEGALFDPAGLVIALKYSDGSEVHVDYEGNESKFSFDPSLDTPLKASDTEITVYYGGMSASLEITVSECCSPIWWMILLVAALALLILFIVLKRRKDDEEESVG